MSGERLSEERLRDLEAWYRAMNDREILALIEDSRRMRRLEAALEKCALPALQHYVDRSARGAGGGAPAAAAIVQLRAALAEAEDRP